ncbi:ubiquinone biosynthesis accessory factor UbiJ [Chitinilyticum piscinae]|uniref:Ubiquinone biosynthesis accessory factor UbiJ n=1 Tax=Chitinilyticum piscinae TaxID=2866724 RepID=A0A8J7FJA3_9NEIS|nr:sterol-binding protein [Chitinilyticum piscinae]MBE9609045.1 sterol-binding protein [Chitinilyticum piscinae]
MLLATALNRLLKHAPERRDELLRLAGRTVKISVPLTSAVLVVTGDGRLAHSQAEPEAVLDLPLAFFYTRMADPQAAARQVVLDGDPELGAALGNVLGKLRWDAAEELSQLVGDVAARRIVWLAGKVGGIPGAIGSRLLLAWVEYLRDEAPLLLDKPAAVQHYAAVDALRDDLARLEKRLQRIEHKAGIKE